ncbi:MAG: calcium/sodium antiporter [Luminiphilus sp.]|nr:calcium/sodium antiporter [Luminiphilus sp.]
MTLNFVVIALGLLALLWSADQFVEGAAAIARSVGMSPLLIGMTIVSVGTSAPEILVSLMAALTGSGELAVGNALGSNIANIGLVLGITLLISPIVVGRTTAFIDLPILLGVIVLCGISLADAVLSLVDASLLTGALLLYLIRIGSHLRRPDPNDTPATMPEMPMMRAVGVFSMGLVVLITSSRALVWAAVNIAEGFGVSELVIGLTIVAFGTSLPELAASAVSAIRGHADIAIGAVVGSNMFNLLIVLALPGFFETLHLSISDIQRDLGTVLATTVALTLFIWLGWRRDVGHARLGRRAGCLFLAMFVFYYIWLFYYVPQV